jgi:hypothetical protein
LIIPNFPAAPSKRKNGKGLAGKRPSLLQSVSETKKNMSDEGGSAPARKSAGSEGKHLLYALIGLVGKLWAGIKGKAGRM